MVKSKEIGERALKIIEVWGSCGMPSCGGAHNGQQVEFVGGATEEIQPGTPRWMFPFSLIHHFLPYRHSKTPRNMERHIKGRGKPK
ncbi:hypothetical protein HZC27_02060 [Candidatus Roizmanbacteria bacterium]|nr:hypothetical protein [Candidatus Roizmanbacteria bacterium]